MPSINFDEDAKSTIEEIKCIKVSVFRKLFNNKTVCNEILPILFPENKSLVLLQEYFSLYEDKHSIYKTLSEKIKKIFCQPWGLSDEVSD